MMTTKQEKLPNMKGPGIAPVEIPELTAAVGDYEQARDARIEVQKSETTAKKTLIDLLHANADKIGRQPDGAIVYKVDDLIASLRPSEEKLKVSRESDGSGKDGNNGDE